MPREGETSVFRTSGLSEDGLWMISTNEVVPQVERPSLGRADLDTYQVRQTGLDVLPDLTGCQHPRHAVIRGWPQERDDCLDLALTLARAAIAIRVGP